MHRESLNGIVATWFVADCKENSSFFPQIGRDSSQPDVQDIYWRCIACFFASSVRIGNRTRHILFSNVGKAPVVDGLDLAKFLQDLGVEHCQVPITHRLGREKAPIFNNQFYGLDIIRFMDDNLDFDAAVILDSDCVWVRPSDHLLKDAVRREILGLCIPYAEDVKANGVSRRDLQEALKLLTGALPKSPPHYHGGEIFAASRSGFHKFRQMADTYWPHVQTWSAEETLVREEAHFFSLICELLNVPVGTADPYIKRMWTSLRYSNVTREDLESSLCIWHLPAEKRSGFAELFRAIANRESWFWRTNEGELRSGIAATMGVPRRGFYKLARDLRSKCWERIASLASTTSGWRASSIADTAAERRIRIPHSAS